MVTVTTTNKYSSLSRIRKSARLSIQVYEIRGEIFRAELAKTTSLEHWSFLGCEKNTNKDLVGKPMESAVDVSRK